MHKLRLTSYLTVCLLYICRSPLWVLICKISDYLPPGKRGGTITERRRPSIFEIMKSWNCRKVYTFWSVNGNIEICIKNKIFGITTVKFFFHKLFKYCIFIMVYLQIFTMVTYFLRWTLLKFFNSFPDEQSQQKVRQLDRFTCTVINTSNEVKSPLLWEFWIYNFSLRI